MPDKCTSTSCTEILDNICSTKALYNISREAGQMPPCPYLREPMSMCLFLRRSNTSFSSVGVADPTCTAQQRKTSFHWSVAFSFDRICSATARAALLSNRVFCCASNRSITLSSSWLFEHYRRRPYAQYIERNICSK